MHILQCTKFCSLPSSATPIAPPSHCYGCTNYSPHPSSISLTVMDSMGKIVTDAHLTMYSVLFPSLLSHTYYSSLSLLRMHKLHSPILYPSLLLLRMHNFPFLLYYIFPITVKVDIKANHVVNQLIRGEGHPGGCLKSRTIY